MYLISKKTVYVIVAVVVAIIVTAVICNAESHTGRTAAIVSFDDLTFTDIADLDRQTDSVLAVCDTLWDKTVVDSLVAEGWDVYNPITCRRFAGLTVWNMPGDLQYYTPIAIRPDELLGHARLWWWEVSP